MLAELLVRGKDNKKAMEVLTPPQGTAPSVELLSMLARIQAFHVGLFGEFLAKLDSVKEGDGSLLDHSLMLYGCGMSDSNLHLPANLPTLVVGGRLDIMRSPAASKAIADQIPGARYAELETGHFMAVQTPELFLETVIPFLQGR